LSRRRRGGRAWAARLGVVCTPRAGSLAVSAPPGRRVHRR